jgi:hypothetical protein
LRVAADPPAESAGRSGDLVGRVACDPNLSVSPRYPTAATLLILAVVMQFGGSGRPSHITVAEGALCVAWQHACGGWGAATLTIVSGTRVGRLIDVIGADGKLTDWPSEGLTAQGRNHPALPTHTQAP